MAKQIVLALGGGGVRGIAHLGAVQCLLDNDYEINGIAGTSAGGMFGAPLAAQVPSMEILAAVTNFFKSPDFRRGSSDSASLVGTTGIEHVLAKFIEGKKFIDLPSATDSGIIETSGTPVELEVTALTHAAVYASQLPLVRSMPFLSVVYYLSPVESQEALSQLHQ